MALTPCWISIISTWDHFANVFSNKKVLQTIPQVFSSFGEVCAVSLWPFLVCIQQLCNSVFFFHFRGETTRTESNQSNQSNHAVQISLGMCTYDDTGFLALGKAQIKMFRSRRHGFLWYWKAKARLKHQKEAIFSISEFNSLRYFLVVHSLLKAYFYRGKATGFLVQISALLSRHSSETDEEAREYALKWCFSNIAL